MRQNSEPNPYISKEVLNVLTQSEDGTSTTSKSTDCDEPFYASTKLEEQDDTD